MMIFITIKRALLLSCVVLLTAMTAFGQTPAPSIEEVARRIGFSAEAIGRAKKGEVVAEDLTGTSDKDLAVAVGVEIDAPPKAVFDFVDADKLAKFQTVTISEGEVEAAPAKSPGKAKHKLYWALQKGRDQQAPVLIHRILYTQDDAKVVVDRRFYSGYDYDSLQIVVGILPTSDGKSAVA